MTATVFVMRSRSLHYVLLASLLAIMLIGGSIVIRHTHQVEAACRACTSRFFHADVEYKPPNWLNHSWITRHLKSWRGQSYVSAINSCASPPLQLSDDDWIAILQHARQLPQVHFISFHAETDSAITGRTLETLSDFPCLVRLELDRTQIIDDDLAAISTLTSLRSLSLDHTMVTGVGLIALRQLPRLESLSLDGTPLTEEGIKAIGSLKQLTSISISNVPLAESDILRLKESLPDVVISDD